MFKRQPKFSIRMALLSILLSQIIYQNLALAEINCVNQQIESSNFDFDDNLFVTDAHIQLWDSVNKIELSVSTAYWAVIKVLLGQEGPYKNFVLAPNGLGNFNDSGVYGKNLFKKQIEEAIARQDQNWQGPRWQSFVKAMSCPQTRQVTSIITARGNSPEAILAGLQVLKDQGLIPATPELDHIYAVQSPQFPQDLKGKTDPESKANVMMSLLDKIEKQPVTSVARWVLNREGTAQDQLHLWNFSDDDYGNFSKAVEALSAQVRANRWPHIKVTVYFTGLNNPNHLPMAVVLRSDGSLRAMVDLETNELN